ncbi:TAXI family TRAP transporter solute-binding subunit [Actinosynnema pretiosum subsp. pretiosum]|uniref:TAXI family TRAP transporter solute-binding subunit n=1 Tax=Actinosynnema pretiosum subsp. pretiosum TaxID=103721 RepID=A0AA45LAW1_9PSEU|nr:TRAP transporter solute receptor, TAXI family precursor [Actinosynnema pretiosum subsp. pretiosum]QUF06218.1 TAXI family TRAP transporter solute-binding subunit [Actinosynnema pretiosum subsp. pretiosum]
MTTRRTALLACALTPLLVTCAPSAPPTPAVIAAGEEGGFYLDFATLLAAQLPFPATPRATEGSRDNLHLLATDQAALALTLADAAQEARDLRALGRVYENYLQLVVPADSPARTASDLRGLRVSLGAPGSGAALAGARLFTALDLHRDTRVDHLPFRTAARELAEGRIDALLWSGGVPTPVLADLGGVRLLPLADALPALRALGGDHYEQVTVPAGVYGAAAEVRTIGVANLLVCRPDLPDATADATARTLVGRAASLVPGQALGAQFLDVRSLITTTGVPLHPGAASAYRDLHG